MYSQRITRTAPALFVFLLDRSVSMASGITGRDQAKAEFVADVVNTTIANLALSCVKEGGVYDYVHLAVLGYGEEVASALPSGPLRRPISHLASSPIRLETRRVLVGNGIGGTEEREVQQPVWVEARADGLTPMSEALERAAALVEEWVQEFPSSFPPVVINITDGGATDADPRPAAERLRKLASADGDALLFNVHVSDQGGTPVLYPGSYEDLTGVDDGLADVLFEMSSPIPPMLVERAAASGIALRPGARGMVYMADATEVVRFVDFGTSTGLAT
jgi:hypothetical protein